MNGAIDAPFSDTTIYVAIELSISGWLVGLRTSDDGKTALYKLRSGDLDALLIVMGRAAERTRKRLGGDVRILACHEAGRDGFWIHRALTEAGIESRVVDSTSVLVNRRSRRAKTDRLDVGGLLRVLMAYERGDRLVCRMVRVPTPEEEDAKRTHRERKRLVKERTAHINRIRALLATQGIYHYWPQKADARERLEVLRTRQGEALPPRLLAMLRREMDRLELVQRQIKEVEAARDAVFHVQPVVGETPCKIQALAKLRGIGPEFATVLATEVFYRRFENRRQLAAFVGLTPSPYMSGDLRRDQGISKAGSPMVRATMLELAWVWLMHQKQSRLARWFAERVGVARGRVRRIVIVALARKLLVALWRYAETGLVPEGAALKVT